jgi:hypothetical protein
MRFVRKMRLLNVAIRMDVTFGVQGGKHPPKYLYNLTTVALLPSRESVN